MYRLQHCLYVGRSNIRFDATNKDGFSIISTSLYEFENYLPKWVESQTFLSTPPRYLMAARSQRASSGQTVWHAAPFQNLAPRQTAVGGTDPPAHLQAPNKDSPSSSQPEETAAWSGETEEELSVFSANPQQIIVISVSGNVLPSPSMEVAHWWIVDLVDVWKSRWVRRLPD